MLEQAIGSLYSLWVGGRRTRVRRPYAELQHARRYFAFRRWMTKQLGSPHQSSTARLKALYNSVSQKLSLSGLWCPFDNPFKTPGTSFCCTKREWLFKLAERTFWKTGLTLFLYSFSCLSADSFLVWAYSIYAPHYVRLAYLIQRMLSCSSFCARCGGVKIECAGDIVDV